MASQARSTAQLSMCARLCRIACRDASVPPFPRRGRSRGATTLTAPSLAGRAGHGGSSGRLPGSPPARHAASAARVFAAFSAAAGSRSTSTAHAASDPGAMTLAPGR